MEKINWEKYWNEYRKDGLEQESDLFFQVGKTINKEPISKKLFEQMVNNIVVTLSLSNDDILLEMCCGNGLVTYPLSDKCKKVYAFDFTNHLIETAKEKSSSNKIVYEVGNAKNDFLSLFKFEENPNKIVMCVSLGYFTPEELYNILKYLDENLTVFSFLITEIPNDELKWNFYNTAERKEFYYSLLEKGDYTFNGMGRWWSYNEIEEIAKKLNLSCEIQKQNEIYNYRMDVLFEKNKE